MFSLELRESYQKEIPLKKFSASIFQLLLEVNKKNLLFLKIKTKQISFFIVDHVLYKQDKY